MTITTILLIIAGVVILALIGIIVAINWAFSPFVQLGAISLSALMNRNSSYNKKEKL